MGGERVWKKALEFIPELERAHPSLNHAGPHLEYPFELKDGTVGWPARDLAVANALGDPAKASTGRLVLEFAGKLSEKFDVIFLHKK
jgi:hypothetical protein